MSDALRLSDVLPPSAAEIVRLVIHQRRSVKPVDFLDRPVDRDVILDLLEAANWAPTHGLTEPWRFTVFTGAARGELADALAAIYRQITPVAEQRAAKLEKLRQNLSLAPCAIAIGMHRQPSGRIPEIEEIAAVACAVQNLHLLATARGLAGYWSSGELICSSQFADYLGYRSPDRVLGLFYLGYPARPAPPGVRTPAADKIDWR